VSVNHWQLVVALAMEVPGISGASQGATGTKEADGGPG
jgi:hypothetical protein